MPNANTQSSARRMRGWVLWTARNLGAGTLLALGGLSLLFILGVIAWWITH